MERNLNYARAKWRSYMQSDAYRWVDGKWGGNSGQENEMRVAVGEKVRCRKEAHGAKLKTMKKDKRQRQQNDRRQHNDTTPKTYVYIYVWYINEEYGKK
ncbi:hypothetical protein PV325_003520 [Microctonus aethiopoides]|nr:hypothetical protein PV325_003520 [Microctonus aethiopoides]